MTFFLLQVNFLNFFLGIGILENINNFYIRYKLFPNTKYYFNNNFRNFKVSYLFQLSENLFSGLNFLHHEKLSLNGNFELCNIIFEVSNLWFSFFLTKTKLKFFFPIQASKKKFKLNVNKLVSKNDVNHFEDIFMLGLLIRKILQRRFL